MVFNKKKKCLESAECFRRRIFHSCEMTRKSTVCLISFSINGIFLLYLLTYYTHLNIRKSQPFSYDDIVINNGNYSNLEDRKGIRCFDKDVTFKITQHGRFFVLNNYVQSSVKFRCSQSITYATHADYTYLENLIVLSERWSGPVSVAVHAPGRDFSPALSSILHLRRCGPRKIKELVTFHVYFANENFPAKIPHPRELNRIETDCSSPGPYSSVDRKSTFRHRNGLLYPVNVGRNIARENAMTHFILASDIELFPNPGLIPKFLSLVDRPQDSKRRVYPLPVFEIRSKMELPKNKSELVTMIKSGNAQIFHKLLCPSCHQIPFYGKWLDQEEGERLNVFHVAKRQDLLAEWEPIYIGTNDEPFYDERLSWEGKRDKMTQGYIMCILDYEFHILDNAFLTHKPGIKRVENNFMREYTVRKTLARIYSEIYPELKALFGDREGCKL